MGDIVGFYHFPDSATILNLSFVVTLETMGLRRIGHVCEIVGKPYDIVRQSNDSRTMTYDFTKSAW